MSVYIISIICIAVYLFHSWLTKRYNHWTEKGIKGPKPAPFLGNLSKVLTFKQSYITFTKQLYHDYPGEKYVGYYKGFRPTLLLRDPEVIKQIIIKYFNVFPDRGIKTSHDIMDDNLVMVDGETWRILRQRVTSIFTSGKLNNMMPLIQNSVDEFVRYVDDLVTNQQEHELRDLSSRYTLSAIGSCAFGVEMNAFSEDKNAYKDIIDDFLHPRTSVLIAKAVDTIVPGFEEFLRKLKIVQQYDRIRPFFLSLVNKIIQEREGKATVRNDFMDLMIELKEQGKISNLEFTPGLIAAQAFIFQAAGFEGSSGMMSFLLHQLAYNQDIQDKAHKNISEVYAKHKVLTYESLNELRYLEMCMDETLRKFSIASRIQRTCTADYVLPGSNLKIDKGTSLMIPIRELHNDPKYFPNPEVFDPERFTPAAKATRPLCCYLPFGEGPRHCIGVRFAKVQSLMGLAAFLRSYKVEPSAKSDPVINFSATSFALSPDKGLYVKISKR